MIQISIFMWYITQNDESFGPYETEHIPKLIQEGIINPETPVWCEGMADWQAAGNTPLASHFTQPTVNEIPVATVVVDPAAKLRNRKMNLWALAGMGWMFGALVVAIGMQNEAKREATSGEPKRMTLAELVKNGPGPNPYVEITNLRFGEQFWLEQDRNTDGWTAAWTFLFNENDPANPVAAAHIDGGGENAMTTWMSATSLKGLAEERPRFFKSPTADELYKMYPKGKSANLKWYIEVTNQRPSEGGVKFAYYSGATLLVAGVIFAIMALRLPKANS